RQFAVTVAISVVLSGVVALTLTPALCALLLKPHTPGGPTRAERWFAPCNRGFQWLTERYLHGVDVALRRRLAALVAFGLMLGGAGWLLVTVPSSFVPEEDQGYIIASVVLPDGATLARTQRATETQRQMNADNTAIQNFFAINGFDFIGGGAKVNAATIFIPMKPWEQRRQSAQALAQAVSGM
ncbi:efflux RND transporter permease subunit, partial [Cutibacterium acnes]